MSNAPKLDDWLFHEIVEFAQNFQPEKSEVNFTSESLQVKVNRSNGTIQVWDTPEETDKDE